MEWRDVVRRLAPGRMIAPDVEDELAFHIEERVRELVRTGVPEAEARRRVLERFGDVEAVERACRGYDAQRIERRTRRMTMEAWARDVRYTLRGMARNPGFAAAVLVTLALGIGATTAVFSVLEGFLLRPLPYADPDRLVVIWQNDRATGTTRENASPADFYDYVERARGFDGMAMYWLNTAVLSGGEGEPTQLATAMVTRELPDVLGGALQLGRTFSAEEDRPDGAAAVILSDALWRTRFQADPGVLGSTVTIDDRPHAVVGVRAPRVDVPATHTDVWLPLQHARATSQRQSHYVTVVARREAGTTVEAAQAELTRVMAELEAEFPEANTNRGAFVEPVGEVGRGDLRLTLWVLFGAVLAVLVIACVNVANLLLARGAVRGRELAVHAALGAGVGVLRRRFLVEGVTYTALACLAGLALAGLGVRGLGALAPGRLLRLGEPSINAAVLLFTVGVGAVVGLFFALLPTFQFRRASLQSELRDGRSQARGSARLGVRRLLVASQLSLAVVLLVGAVLLMRTLGNLQAVDPGFRAANVLRMDFTLPATRYPRDFADWPEWTEVHGFNRSLIEGLRALPGVEEAAVVTNHPLDPGFTNSFVIEGRPYDPDQGEITTRMVSPGYFEVAGLDLVQGRLPHPSDGPADPHVVVINRMAAERYFPEGGALGARIQIWGQFREVVGIVENERVHGLAQRPPPGLYVNILQSPPVATKITAMVRTEVPPMQVVEGARGVFRSLDPGLAVFNVATMEDTLADASARERFASVVLIVFAGVAVFLAVLGVHGVLAYLVAQRGHEVGVRMALGATKRDVVQSIVRQGAAMTALGLVLGLVGAVALSRVLEGLLFGVRPTEPWVYAGVAGGLALVALAASALPAWRAASIQPASALRGE